MNEWAASFLVATTAVFVVVEPFGALPVFVALTRGRPVAEVRSIALRASLVGAAILGFFTLFGQLLFEVLRLDLSAFRVAGGLLLLLTALDMLRGEASSCKCSKREVEADEGREDLAVVPLAMPLLAGPGSIATVMVLTAERSGVGGTFMVLLAVAFTFGAALLVLRAGARLQRLLTPSVMGVVQRVLGLLLAAIAIQFMAEGAAQWLRAHDALPRLPL